ncbi:MAG: GDSL-type esterase/lipase family protein [bacterium]
MAFFPQTSRERKILLALVFLLFCLGTDIYFGARYAAQRDTDFRAFRWDSGTLWRLKNSYRGEAFGQPVHTDAAGFRGPEEYAVKSTHAHRILAIGDSRTYGFGLQDSETFAAVAQAELRNRGLDAEVINAGVHGYSALQCRVRLANLLQYRPGVVIFAPGYNDRRYLVVRPPDSEASFAWIARGRRIADILEWSNTVFALGYEMGQRRLRPLKDNPPPLDEVPVRVEKDRFREELEKAADLCRDHGVRLIFLLIYQDPGAYGLVEKASRLFALGEYREAVERMEEARNTIPDRAFSLSRYCLGLCYRRLGDEARARECLANHRPWGSIFGESILRPEWEYFDVFREVAARRNIPIVDGREAMRAEEGDPREADEAFRRFFIDECHYNAEAARRLGLRLADELARTLQAPL